MWLIPLAGQAHGRGVDDRHQLGEVVQQQPVEQRRVAVLELSQVDVPFEVGRLVVQGFIGAADLLVQRLLVGRQQAQQAQFAPLLRRERGPLVEERPLQQELAGEGDLQDIAGLRLDRARDRRLHVHRPAPPIRRPSPSAVPPRASRVSGMERANLTASGMTRVPGWRRFGWHAHVLVGMEYRRDLSA